MPKTFEVHAEPVNKNVGIRNDVPARQSGFTAREAARAAVKAVKQSKGTANAFVYAAGRAFPEMVCSRTMRTHKGKTPRRGFVRCTPMPKFKALLKSPKKRKRR
jgi:hypothetical protein